MTSIPSYFSLADLHAHLAASINPSVYWNIAHEQGFKLPQENFRDFIDNVTLSPQKKTTMKQYFDEIYHPLLDKLSSGTYAVEKAVYESMSGAYKNHITLIELRNNPMKHNNGGEQDLDYIILSMLRGMEKALLEYKELSAGIIFCLDRQFPQRLNEIIIDKAIKYKRRGIVGIDFANYNTEGFHFKDYQQSVERAKSAGLKVTAHSGETHDTNDMWEALEFVQPSRIGHGIRAAYDKKLMEELVKQDIVLEICPLSNIVTKAVENIEEMKFILKTFLENNVKFCINTDWPEIIENAHLAKQLEMLQKENLLSVEEIKKCNEIAFASSFIPTGGLAAYL